MRTKFFWLISLAFFVIKGQDHPVYQKIHHDILLKYPELNNKEILISLSPPKEENKASWQKTQSTFAHAKLKGGRSGFQIILLYEEGKIQDEIMLKKYESLGFKIMTLNEDTYHKIKSIHSVLLDAEGKVMETRIDENNLFNHILNHITR